MRPGPRLVRTLAGLAGAAALLALLPLVGWAGPSSVLAPALPLVLGLPLVALLAGLEGRYLEGLEPWLERSPAVLSLGTGEHLPWRLGVQGVQGVQGVRGGQGVRGPGGETSGADLGQLRLRLLQRWPDLLEPAGYDAVLPSPEERGPGSAELAVEPRVVPAARGEAFLEPARLVITRRGWLERVVPVGEPVAVTVLPDLPAVGRLHQRLDRLFLQGLGQRVSPRLGKGREFERLREYVVGDDLRDVDWKASARHGAGAAEGGGPVWITREYRLERSQDVVVCLDTGHRMATRVAAPALPALAAAGALPGVSSPTGGLRLTRLDHAVNAALLVAALAERMEDRFGLLTFDAEADRGLGQRRGRLHLRQVIAYLAAARPGGSGAVAGGPAAELPGDRGLRPTDYRTLAAHLRRRLKSRALVLLLTALPELGEEADLVAAVELLTPQHLPLVVTFADPDLAAVARARPDGEEALYRTLVARDLWQRRRRTVRELLRRGALVTEARPGDVGLAAINAYLDVKRRQLL